MNVLETAKILLQDYPITFIQYEAIQLGQGRTPCAFQFEINNIEYQIEFKRIWPIDSNKPIRSNTLCIYVGNKKGITHFTYMCNDIEKFDIMSYMREAETNYYNKFISEITVHPINICPDMNIKGVEISCNPDML